MLLLFLVVVMVVLDIRMGGMLIPYLPQPKVQVMSVERKEKKNQGERGWEMCLEQSGRIDQEQG